MALQKKFKTTFTTVKKDQHRLLPAPAAVVAAIEIIAHENR
jgi:hypothetical protein